MNKFPYKDEDIQKWIYNQVPEGMIRATSLNELKIGRLILYKSSISTLAGYFIATEITGSNIKAVRECFSHKEIYLKKSGV